MRVDAVGPPTLRRVKVLVTGGAGFIGSHFVRALAAGAYSGLTGASVVVLDCLSYAGRRARIEDLLGDQVQLVVGDIRDRALVDRLMPGTGLIVHFAAESHVDRSITGAADFILTNLAGTQTLLDSAVEHGAGRFVHVSTDEVYGSIETGSWTEDQPLAPSSPYSASKAGSDLLVLACARTHGLDVVVTRGSNTYGPGQFPEKIIPLFVTQLLAGRTVPLYGDGMNVRDWLHVSDHCAGVALAATRGRAGEIYHVGGGTELTNRELTRRLLMACGRDWRSVEPVADRKGHDRRYSLDISKSSSELGYAPAVPFDDGLAETVSWYRANPSWFSQPDALG